MSIVGLALLSDVGALLLFALGLSFVVFVHEVGHFLAARRCDVRIERFAIGFGTELFGFTRKETRYSFNVLPLGGYVKMMGQEDFSVDKSGEIHVRSDPRAYSNKPVGQRMMIVSAGVLMNVIFASILFMIAFMIGMRVIPARIGTVLPDTAAWRAGLRPGDQILSINGTSTNEWTDVMMATMLADPDTPLGMQVRQGTRERTVSLEPEYNAVAGVRQISLGNPQSLTVAYTDPAIGPKENQQLQVDDQIIALQGKPVTDISKVFLAIAAAQGRPVELTVKRPSIERDGKPVLDENGGQVTKEVSLCRRARITLGPASNPNLLGAMPRMQIGDVPEGSQIDEMDLVIARVLPDSPMSMAGMVDKGRITAVNDLPVSDWFALIDALRQNAGNAVKLTFEADGQVRTGELVVPGSVAPDSTDPWAVRVSYAETFVTYPEMELLKITNPAMAIWLGIRRTSYFLIQTYISTRQMLFTQQIGAEQMSGPVGIIHLGTQIAAAGSAQLIYFLAFLSVNFALVNSLPFPIVDGGHFFFLLIEKIKGKPLSVRVQMTTQVIGLAMIFVAFVFLTIQDVLFWQKS